MLVPMVVLTKVLQLKGLALVIFLWTSKLEALITYRALYTAHALDLMQCPV